MFYSNAHVHVHVYQQHATCTVHVDVAVRGACSIAESENGKFLEATKAKEQTHCK